MDIYDRLKETLETFRDALERAEPLVDSGQKLLESTDALVGNTSKLVTYTRTLVGTANDTLARCDRILERGPGLADRLGELMRAHTELAEMEKELLALRIAREKQAGPDPG